jgi:predicted metal-dependent HD superfamily phosphohydrolase
MLRSATVHEGGREQLVERWLAALPTGSDSATARRTGGDLLARWQEPHRRYHGLAHLTVVLSIVDANGTLADDLAAVRLAAWFHDAVYDPAAGGNEEASAGLAERLLSDLNAPTSLVSEVARLVRLTAGHVVEAGDRNGALLADADLAILAAEQEAYDEYAVAIRREYAHVPDSLYRMGRRKVLEALLDLPELYRIVPARAQWTERARVNLRREIAALARSA